ncbi:hypothetical protein [Ktedonospora formicarum]|uniref:VWFA domain-containing protein n=1 Tax=Ktedonospora formicarum TaxID=2778364 RepID=A0A8J3IAU2_9CHLR|nr:hypothetical protein [Ktedonospora formicarum]GHO47919.1 hypothetical protein KSX_60820 [Ktedonospora formicarum]
MTDNQQNSQFSASDIQDLFQDAQATPNRRGISQQTREVLVQNLTPVTIAGAQGVSSDVLGGDRAQLIFSLLDMTGSMLHARKDVIKAYNALLDTLKGSRQADQMLLSTWTFNTAPYLLHGYTPVEFAPPLDMSNYEPDDATALYDAVMHAIVGAVAYGQELRNQGVRTRITCVVYTDGYDNVSQTQAQQVRQIVTDLLAQEMYTFVLVGFGHNLARKIADELGFPNALEAKSDADSIKQALNLVSRSLIRNAQGTATSSAPNAFFQ